MVEAPVEQHLLVAHEHVGHGIHAQERAQPSLLHPVEIEHGGGEKPQVHEMREEALHVAEVHGQGGDEEREAEGEHELHEKGQGQEQGGGPELAVGDEKAEEHGQAQQELHHVGEHGDHGQDLRGEEDLLDEVAPGDDHAGRLQERRGEPAPGQDPAEEKEGVGLHGGQVAPGQDDGEDHDVDEQHEERVHEAPEEPEHAAPVAGLELARDQALDEEAIAEEGADLLDHACRGRGPRPKEANGLFGKNRTLRWRNLCL